ncbi:class B sortase [Eubacterium multiforme]|nr:class B sortase [Eubacterium multiforme]
MKKSIKRTINIILIVIIIFSGAMLINRLYEYHKIDSVNKEIQLINKDDLSKINSDYKFWIEVPGTNINYPVVQTNNNEFYLNHNFYKKNSIGGSIFLDSRDNINKSQNLIIFGHNMKNKSMFGTLDNFKDKTFFNNNKYIYLFKDNKKYTYEIFSGAIVKGSDNYLITDFSHKDDFSNYIKMINSKSIVSRKLTFNNDSKILTLSTCSYEFDDARFIILAKLIK